MWGIGCVWGLKFDLKTFPDATVGVEQVQAPCARQTGAAVTGARDEATPTLFGGEFQALTIGLTGLQDVSFSKQRSSKSSSPAHPRTSSSVGMRVQKAVSTASRILSARSVKRVFRQVFMYTLSLTPK